MLPRRTALTAMDGRRPRDPPAVRRRPHRPHPLRRPRPDGPRAAGPAQTGRGRASTLPGLARPFPRCPRRPPWMRPFAPPPRRFETGDRRWVLSTPRIVFLVVAAAAPLAAMVGNLPIALGRGNGAGTPSATFLFRGPHPAVLLGRLCRDQPPRRQHRRLLHLCRQGARQAGRRRRGLRGRDRLCGLHHRHGRLLRLFRRPGGPAPRPDRAMARLRGGGDPHRRGPGLPVGRPVGQDPGRADGRRDRRPDPLRRQRHRRPGRRRPAAAGVRAAPGPGAGPGRGPDDRLHLLHRLRIGRPLWRGSRRRPPAASRPPPTPR